MHRVSGAAVPAVTGLVVACLVIAGCAAKDRAGPEPAAGEPTTIALPDGFSPLEMSNVAEELVTAMYWVRVAKDDPEVPPELLAMVRETTEQVTPEGHLSVIVATTALQPVEVEERPLGEVAVWYEGEADTAEAAVTTEDARLAEVLRQSTTSGWPRCRTGCSSTGTRGRWSSPSRWRSTAWL